MSLGLFTYEGIFEAQDIPLVADPGGGPAKYDHGALAGLADDDHEQYLPVVGRNNGESASIGTATITGNDSLSVGIGNQVSANVSLTVGRNNINSGGSSVAFGSSCTASGGNSLAGGTLSIATQDSSVALGRTCTSSGVGSVALGTNVGAAALNSIAIGFGSFATGERAIGIGSEASASGFDSISIGQRTTNNAAGCITISANKDGGPSASSSVLSQAPSTIVCYANNTDAYDDAVRIVAGPTTGTQECSVKSHNSTLSWSYAPTTPIPDWQDLLPPLTPAPSDIGSALDTLASVADKEIVDTFPLNFGNGTTDAWGSNGPISADITYRVKGRLCTIYMPAVAANAQNGAATIDFDTLPPMLRPTGRNVFMVPARDDGVDAIAFLRIEPNGDMVFERLLSNWTGSSATGQTGAFYPYSVTYII
jgi:hypothetical protein